MALTAALTLGGMKPGSGAVAMRMRSEREAKTKPQGSAASWGMVKGVMSRSPMKKLGPEGKYSTAGGLAGFGFPLAWAVGLEDSSSSGSGGSSRVGLGSSERRDSCASAASAEMLAM